MSAKKSKVKTAKAKALRPKQEADEWRERHVDWQVLGNGGFMRPRLIHK